MCASIRRPLIAVTGEAGLAALAAREILARGLGRPVLISASAGEAAAAADDLAADVLIGKDLSAVEGCQVVVLTGDAARRREALSAAATCIARHAPEAVVVVGGPGSNSSARAFLRASRQKANLVIGAGGVAGQRSRAASLAAILGLSRSQVSVLVIGDEEPLLSTLLRYTAAAGVPLSVLGAPSPQQSGRAPAPVCGPSAHAAAIGAVAEAILRDRKRVLCCGSLIEAGHGLPTCFATVPAIVGARGVEHLFPVSLTLEERAFLQRAAATIEEASSA